MAKPAAAAKPRKPKPGGKTLDRMATGHLGPAARALVAKAGAVAPADGQKRTTGLPLANGWPADKIERWGLDALTPYTRNARTHSPEQVGELVRSIETFGWTMPVLVDEDGVIIAGHGRVMAAERLGLKEVPVMVAAGWTDAQKRAYGLADNKLALNAGWDPGLLRDELLWLGQQGVDPALMGFSDVELVTFLATPPDPNKDPNALPAAGPPVSRLGDLWQLGKHRLLCGDATAPADVTRALDGAHPVLMDTDPPYGVNYDPAWRVGLNRGDGTYVAKVAEGEVHNDQQADWTPAWRLFPGDVAYVWHGAKHCSEVERSLQAAGFEARAQCIWAKEHFPISRGDYHWQHEPVWYAVRRGRTSNWQGDRKQTTLWQIGALIGWSAHRDGDKSAHSTQKPIECMARPIRNNTKPGQVVYDPFCGSGSTIVACEMLNRACRALELAPGHVDIAVRRWQDYAGAAATLAGDGRTFAEIAKERGVAPPQGGSHEPAKPTTAAERARDRRTARARQGADAAVRS